MYLHDCIKIPPERMFVVIKSVLFLRAAILVLDTPLNKRTKMEMDTRTQNR